MSSLDRFQFYFGLESSDEDYRLEHLQASVLRCALQALPRPITHEDVHSLINELETKAYESRRHTAPNNEQEL